MWFAQVETQFALAGITTEDTKFNYVAGNLDSKYAIEIRDILTSPPENVKYTKLKSELIRRLSAAQDQKTRRLLEHEVAMVDTGDSCNTERYTTRQSS